MGGGIGSQQEDQTMPIYEATVIETHRVSVAAANEDAAKARALDLAMQNAGDLDPDTTIVETSVVCTVRRV
jgi:hypothetical protein